MIRSGNMRQYTWASRRRAEVLAAGSPGNALLVQQGAECNEQIQVEAIQVHAN
jgi:hypothetical protein